MELVLREKPISVLLHKSKNQNEKNICVNLNFSDLNFKSIDFNLLLNYNYSYNYGFCIKFGNAITIFIDIDKSIYIKKFEYSKISNESFSIFADFVNQIIKIIPKKVVIINFEQEIGRAMEYIYSIILLNNTFNVHNKLKINFSNTKLIFEKK